MGHGGRKGGLKSAKLDFSPSISQPCFVPGIPHVILIELRQALIPYQDCHTLSLRIRGLCTGLDRVLRHYEKEGSKMREEGPSDDGGNKPNQAQAVQHMLRYGAWAILDAEDEQARILNPF